MRALLIAFVLALAIPAVANAQLTPEVRPFAGVLIPTGDQRDVLKDALLTGAQLGAEFGGRFHVVGTFGFAGPNFATKANLPGHVHIYASDIGAETFRDMSLSNGWRVRPFVGLGGGVRAYDPTEAKAKGFPTGYAALGSEFQTSRIALRLEGRDYLTRITGIPGQDGAATRNELGISAGFAYHLR